MMARVVVMLPRLRIDASRGDSRIAPTKAYYNWAVESLATPLSDGCDCVRDALYRHKLVQGVDVGLGAGNYDVG